MTKTGGTLTATEVQAAVTEIVAGLVRGTATHEEFRESIRRAVG